MYGCDLVEGGKPPRNAIDRPNPPLWMLIERTRFGLLNPAPDGREESRVA